MKRTLQLILIGILVLSFKSNANAQTQTPQDTVKQISLQDLREFNSYLSRSTSYEDYGKLNPEAILSKLWAWNLNRKQTKIKK